MTYRTIKIYCNGEIEDITRLYKDIKEIAIGQDIIEDVDIE